MERIQISRKKERGTDKLINGSIVTKQMEKTTWKQDRVIIFRYTVTNIINTYIHTHVTTSKKSQIHARLQKITHIPAYLPTKQYKIHTTSIDARTHTYHT